MRVEHKDLFVLDQLERYLIRVRLLIDSFRLHIQMLQHHQEQSVRPFYHLQICDYTEQKKVLLAHLKTINSYRAKVETCSDRGTLLI